VKYAIFSKKILEVEEGSEIFNKLVEKLKIDSTFNKYLNPKRKDTNLDKISNWFSSR
jgi:hypothetical protein